MGKVKKQYTTRINRGNYEFSEVVTHLEMEFDQEECESVDILAHVALIATEAHNIDIRSKAPERFLAPSQVKDRSDDKGEGQKPLESI